jgi:hypothetical protein
MLHCHRLRNRGIKISAVENAPRRKSCGAGEDRLRHLHSFEDEAKRYHDSSNRNGKKDLNG